MGFIRNTARTIYRKYYTRILPNYERELARILKNEKNILDVGCGSSSPLKHIKKKGKRIGVDQHKPSIEQSKTAEIHDEYFEADVLKIKEFFGPNSFECVVALDLIEHLEKEDGFKLLEQMESVASKRVIVFTPNGFLPQGPLYGNPWQRHLSGWTVKEMKKRGYKVIGINGWKPLRGECAKIKFWPSLFWLVISDITQLFIRNHPKNAFQILCIKDLKKK